MRILNISCFTTCLVLLILDWSHGAITLDHVQNLLEVATNHREVYLKSLQDLDNSLSQLSSDQLKHLSTKTRISKRSEVKQLFNSFQAFCNHLNNNTDYPGPSQEHLNNQTDESIKNNQPDKTQANETINIQEKVANLIERKYGKDTIKFTKPDELFKPTKLRARHSRKSKQLIIEITVEHKVPIISYIYITPMFPQAQATNYRFIQNKWNNTKTSIVKFRLNTTNCNNRYYMDNLRIQFSEPRFMGSYCEIRIRGCVGLEQKKWMKFDLDFNYLKWSLANNHLSYADKYFLSLIETSSHPTLAVFSTGYDSRTGNMFTSDVTEKLDKTVGCRVLNPDPYSMFETEGSSLVKTEICDVNNDALAQAMPEYTQPQEPQVVSFTIEDQELSDKTKSGFLHIGLEKVYGLEHETGKFIEDSTHYTSVTLSDDESVEPIPYGQVEFRKPKNVSCLVQRHGYLRGRKLTGSCVLKFLVLGRGIANVTIEKLKSPTGIDFDIKELKMHTQVLENGMARAILFIPKHNPKYAGEYVCRAYLTNGSLGKEQKIELKFVER